MLFGGIEAGGTKFVCAIGTGPDDIRSEVRFPTTNPEKTIAEVIRFFKNETIYEPLDAIGIASFGPVDPQVDSPTFGFITNTPKPGWANIDLGGAMGDAFQVPVGFDTDVNGAAYGEYCWGAGKGLSSVLYLTVGTGIGGGAVAEGKIVHGLLHPEMGHIRIPHSLECDPFPGNCPYHNDCFEGLACGKAMAERWGVPAENLGENHPGWELEAEYIAYALANYTLVLSPQVLILGGGVMQKTSLYPKIRTEFQKVLNGYIQVPQITRDLDRYIVPPGLGNRSGVLGAIGLAIDALRRF
jgi:fructokinase